jgi:NADH-quinone oxidoreductase subunit H
MTVQTVSARPRGRLTPMGRIVIPLLAIFLVVGLLGFLGLVTGIIPGVVNFVLQLAGANLGIVRFVIAATAILLISVPIAFIVIYLELKVIALMNLRLGPNRVGPFGSLQSVFHGLKVLAKEDFTPTGADRSAFTIAPVVVFLSVVLTFLVVPFAPGLFGTDMNVGLLYFFAVGGLSVVGLLMAGWSSFNKYSLLGGLRAAAQIVSYEIPLTLSVVGLVMLAGTMSLNSIVEAQGGQFWNWYVFRQPLGFVIFFIAAAAEANRTPFDLTEADSEIVAGFSTEYSGMRFGFFYFAEYVTLFVMSGLTSVLFLGGWHAPIDIHELASFFGRTIPAVSVDPGSLGVGLLLLIALGPVIGTLILTVPVALWRTDWSIWRALLVGFVLFSVVAGGLVTIFAYAASEQVAGVFWFMGKAFTLVFVFVWMRGTLPRVRVDQLMAFAWKWLLPASLINIFVTAIAIVVLK